MTGKNQVKLLTVTELTSEIRFQLTNEFSSVWVSGEVSGLTRPSSGHLYFTLKDQHAQISAVVWRSDAQRLKFQLENGLEVICRGEVDVYPQRGNYQLMVRTAQPQGEGALQLAFRQLQAKLAAEGLFDPQHKKPLPLFPRRVAVITSPSGAAIRDFLQVLRRRWKNIEVVIIPVKVQGPGSADEIVRAIGMLTQFSTPPDVAVLTRGGGSIEDLWSFNEEKVCRAVFDCQIPVICGVGHEIDVSLADLVADVRALTPSEAAERLVPDHREIVESVSSLRKRLGLAVTSKFQAARQQLEILASKSVLTRPLDNIRTNAMELDRFDTRMFRSFQQQLLRGEHQAKELAAKLEAINPLSVLARGYSLTSRLSDELLTDCDSVDVGDTIKTRLAKGTIVSRVESKEN